MEDLSVSEGNTVVPTTANDSVVNVAITTMANSGVSPQINTEMDDVQSAQDFRSTASQIEQLEHQRDEVFSEAPQTQLHVANGSQTVPQNTSKAVGS